MKNNTLAEEIVKNILLLVNLVYANKIVELATTLLIIVMLTAITEGKSAYFVHLDYFLGTCYLLDNFVHQGLVRWDS